MGSMLTRQTVPNMFTAPMAINTSCLAQRACGLTQARRHVNNLKELSIQNVVVSFFRE